MASNEAWTSADETLLLAEVTMPQDSFILRIVDTRSTTDPDSLAVIQLKQHSYKKKRTQEKVPPSLTRTTLTKYVPVAKYSKIELHTYMRQFMYFESLTICIIAMHTASSLNQYFINWKLVEQISLSKRIDIIDELRSDYNDKSINPVNGIKKLSHVRNQLAHNLDPLTIDYKNISRARVDDSTLVTTITNDMNEQLFNILKLYKLVQMSRIDTWLKSIAEKQS